ncbi:EB domain-containing protein [Aphelenchoides bicaudatus]|nr:EB domain-containing protein [Aphelenchoides bicaudatus]
MLAALVFHSSVANGAYMTNSVTNFLSTIHHLGQPTPGNLCSLDSQCAWNKDLICSPNGRCECQVGKWNGKQCTLGTFYDDTGDIGQTGAADVADGQLESSYCLPSEVEKHGKCYIRRKPGEACEHSEQCMNIGEIEYYCIANICQEPPECPPGFVAMGAECLPFSVTGGPCIHPSQCLTGSVCIKGKCRGPCDFNQLFLEESCVDYEGAGCIAKSCISARCPRSFPSCNYIAQKKDYLCCDRSMETKVQCPLPNSEPLLDRETGTVVECMHRPCMANYRCVFASYNRGKYICCSKPKRKDGSDLTTDEEGSEENFSTQQVTTRPPFIPPPPIKPTQNIQTTS